MTGSALAVIGQVLLTGLSPARQLRRRDRPQPHSHWPRRRLCLFCSAIFGGAVSVRPGDTGISGALANTSLQIGGSVGTTVLSLVFVRSVAGYEASRAASRILAQDAAVHGYAAAFWWAAGLFALGFLVATFIIPKRTATPVSQPAAPEPERYRNHDGLPEPGPGRANAKQRSRHHDRNIPSRSPISAYRRDIMSLTAHFGYDTVGYTTHSCCPSFEERP
jgi:hypothetical protein